MSASITETRDRARLERLLRDPGMGGPTWAGYALGDLDDAMFARTRWLLTEDERALLLVFAWGEGGATLMTFGAPERLPDLVRAATPPPRFDLHVREADAAPLLAAVEGPLPPYQRMGLVRDSLRAPAAPAGLDARRLTLDDVPAAREVYASYPGNVFDPARVTTGTYLGAWDGGRLVGVAGTHVVSTRTRAAAVGDVVVRPDRRGQGVGGWLTARLCAGLLADVDRVVLNVARSNVAAIRAYERVGFDDAVPYLEGAGVRLRAPAN